MAKAKRSPIDYTMRYANSFFRPREVVQREEEELAKDQKISKSVNQKTEKSGNQDFRISGNQ